MPPDFIAKNGSYLHQAIKSNIRTSHQLTNFLYHTPHFFKLSPPLFLTQHSNRALMAKDQPQ